MGTFFLGRPARPLHFETACEPSAVFPSFGLLAVPASKQFGQTNPISFLGGSLTHRAPLDRFPFEELPRGFKEIGAAMLAEQPNC